MIFSSVSKIALFFNDKISERKTAGNEIAGRLVFFCFDRVRTLAYIDVRGLQIKTLKR
jgi:hypothetical protein